MDRILLTSGDVSQITGIPSNSLNRWCATGLLRPANEGRGTGRHRLFSLADCISVATGMKYRAEGASDDRVLGVVALLASLQLERLEAHLEAGETFPVPAMLCDSPRPRAWALGMMVRPPADLSPGAAALARRLDLPAIVEDVKRKVARLSRKPAKRKRHNRGLVTVT